MIPSDSNQPFSAEQLMEQELKKCAIAGQYGVRRMGTLERLKTACDDILSGKAHQMAAQKGIAPGLFAQNPTRLNSHMIESYVRMRASFTPDDSKVWTGPTSGGIRNDEALRSYVHKRLHEAAGSSLRRSKRRRPREIEDILKDLPFDDRQLVRFALQEGIEAIKELNLLKETLKGCPAIDFETLMEGRPVGGSNKAFSGALDEHSKVQLRHMLTRLKDNASLAEFGLLFDGVRLKMNYSPNRELIRKSEWQLLGEVFGTNSGSME